MNNSIFTGTVRRMENIKSPGSLHHFSLFRLGFLWLRLRLHRDDCILLNLKVQREHEMMWQTILLVLIATNHPQGCHGRSGRIRRLLTSESSSSRMGSSELLEPFMSTKPFQSLADFVSQQPIVDEPWADNEEANSPADFEEPISDPSEVISSTRILQDSNATNFICSGTDAPIEPNGPIIYRSTNGVQDDGLLACESSFSSPGLYYRVAGTGLEITASTCCSSDFDTYISVFSGSCTELQCVTENDDGGCSSSCWSGSEGGSVVSFVAAPGTMYYIRVHGFSSNTGNFGVLITSSDPPDTTNSCASTTVLNMGTQRKGILIPGPPDAIFCDLSTIGQLKGTWYSVVGNGNIFTVSACSEQTTAST
jgi:hypothetical protein